ncbi:hypothetical protein HDR61_05335 [bacterium]|nr:hypothetical protein [Bacteroidales bacterium]MBD5401131.1 hypothetical protein [bacterium]
MGEILRNIITVEKVYLFVGVFFAVSILVIIAIILDLWDGVHTAKKRKERVHSHKLRVTIGKMSEYWRFILIGFLVDCLGVFFSFYILPFVAVLFGAGLIAVEAKSMFEHANRRKSHTAELPDIVSKIIAAVNSQDAQEIIERLRCIEKKGIEEEGVAD